MQLCIFTLAGPRLISCSAASRLSDVELRSQLGFFNDHYVEITRACLLKKSQKYQLVYICKQNQCMHFYSQYAANISRRLLKLIEIYLGFSTKDNMLIAIVDGNVARMFTTPITRRICIENFGIPYRQKFIMVHKLPQHSFAHKLAQPAF